MTHPSLTDRIGEIGIVLGYVSEVNKDLYFAELRYGGRELKLTDIAAPSKPTLTEIVRSTLTSYDMWANEFERTLPKWARQRMSAEKIDADEIEDRYAAWEAQSIRCREIENFYSPLFSILLYDTNWREA